jgi:ADP-ribose pyrophosphatase YjhB (NUDIX family)
MAITIMSNLNFCTRCGSEVALAIPPGDNLPRHICRRCGHIHYENPRLVVGCVASWNGQLLLCRRAIEPRLGLWTLPGGFMENGETAADAARRETSEEAGANVVIEAPFAMVSIPHINQVHLFYRGQLANAGFAPGEESLEVTLARPEMIPWDHLAFRSVKFCLERYLDDLDLGRFGFHETSIPPL